MKETIMKSWRRRGSSLMSCRLVSQPGKRSLVASCSLSVPEEQPRATDLLFIQAVQFLLEAWPGGSLTKKRLLKLPKIFIAGLKIIFPHKIRRLVGSFHVDASLTHKKLNIQEKLVSMDISLKKMLFEN